MVFAFFPDIVGAALAAGAPVSPSMMLMPLVKSMTFVIKNIETLVNVTGLLCAVCKEKSIRIQKKEGRPDYFTTI